MARKQPVWTYVRLACGCLRSVGDGEHGELVTGFAQCAGRFKEDKKAGQMAIVYVMQSGCHIRPHQCDKPRPLLEAIDPQGQIISEGDTVRILGTDVHRIVTSVTTRPVRRSEYEVVLYVTGQRHPIIPGSVVRVETPAPKRTRKPKEALPA